MFQVSTQLMIIESVLVNSNQLIKKIQMLIIVETVFFQRLIISRAVCEARVSENTCRKASFSGNTCHEEMNTDIDFRSKFASYTHFL